MSVQVSNTQTRIALEVGLCEEHNRPYECFSVEENVPICASCLMFGRFNGQKVISLDEANLKLRNELSKAMRENVLKVENT